MTDQLRDPDLVAIAGDWHGNIRWALHVIEQAAAALPAVPPRIIIQLGDFGFRLHRQSTFLDALSSALEEHDMELWWLDGNHEDWPGIRVVNDCDSDVPPADPGVRVRDRIQYLPRGTRWTWHEKIWLACGGAASVDRLLRTEGLDWFPDEELTDEQAWTIADEGHADVMLTHDCPEGWLPALLPRPSAAWIPELPRARRHSLRLRSLVEAVRPSHIYHGHYHIARDDVYPADWGRIRITGLDMDGFPANWKIVEADRVRT